MNTAPPSGKWRTTTSRSGRSDQRIFRSSCVDGGWRLRCDWRRRGSRSQSAIGRAGWPDAQCKHYVGQLGRARIRCECIGGKLRGIGLHDRHQVEARSSRAVIASDGIGLRDSYASVKSGDWPAIFKQQMAMPAAWRVTWRRATARKNSAPRYALYRRVDRRQRNIIGFHL